MVAPPGLFQIKHLQAGSGTLRRSGVDEAAAILEEDIAQLSMEDPEQEYGVEVAEYSAVDTPTRAEASG